MSDIAILDLFNMTIAAQQQIAADHANTVIEIPPGRPQLEYFEPGDQWVPRGQVLRCHIEDDEQGQAVIYVDEKELSLHEFGRMLTCYAGWGMRIYFVDEDSVAEEPDIEVREPHSDEQ